jgi:DNA-binding phage protein
MEFMEVIEVLNQKRQTYTEIAAKARVSRNTVYNVRRNPERATLGTLRRIFRAMGYETQITLKKLKDE